MERASMDSLRRRLAQATSISMLGIVVMLVMSYPRNMMTARALSPEELGIYTLGSTIFSWLAVIFGQGINTSLAKYIGHYWHDQSRLSAGVFWALRWVLIISCIGAVIVVAISFMTFWLGGSDRALFLVMVLYAMAVPFSVLKETTSQISLGFSLVRENVLFNSVLASTVWTLMIFLSWYFHLGLYAVTFTVPLMFAFSGIGTWIAVRRNLAEPAVNAVDLGVDKKSILLNGVILLASNFAYSFWLKFDNIFLGKYWGTREVGLYAPAYQTAFLLNYMNVAVASFFSPTVSRLLAEGKKAELAALYKETSQWCFHGNLAIYATLLVGAKPFLSLFGHDYMTAETVVSLRILLTGFFLYSFITAPPWILLSMSNNQKKLAISEILMVPVAAVIHFFVTAKYGAIGAAISTSLSLGVAGIIRSMFGFSVCRSFTLDRTAWKLAVVAATILGASCIIVNVIDISFFLLPVVYAVFVCIQAATLLILKDNTLISICRMIGARLSGSSAKIDN
jgi:O-antigen/teichoic acid export membrane protein